MVPLDFFSLLAALGLAMCRLSLVTASGGHSSSWHTGSRPEGIRIDGCGTWAQWLWGTGLVALRHVTSSPTRDQTCILCIGRQLPNHWVTREVWALWILVRTGRSGRLGSS